MRYSILLLTLLILLSCERKNSIIPDPPYSYRDDDPAWSNNGDKIAFFSTGTKQLSDSTRGLYVINSDGSGQIPIDEFEVSLFGSPEWLQGDSEIVYSTHGIYKINTNSREKSLIVDVTASFDISRDGRHIYYTIPSDSLNCKYLILHEDLLSGIIDTVICGFYPSLSSDLRYIAFSKNGSIQYYDFMDNSITPLNLEGAFPDWSPANDLIAYEVPDGLYGLSNIYATDLSAQNYKVVESGRSPNISPDGNKIVYVDYSNHLWIVNIDGTGKTQLTF